MSVADQDDLQRVLDDLAERYGALEVLPADQTGSVSIIAEDGTMFRFTAQSVLIRVGRATRTTPFERAVGRAISRAEGRRS